MNFLISISYIVLSVVFFVPTSIYGAIIGNRIVNNEFRGNIFKKLFVVPFFAAIGACMFPFTYIIMIANWDDVENTLDHIAIKYFGI